MVYGTRRIAELTKDTRGTTALLFGLVVLVAISVTGLCFDAARAHRITARVSSALDAAALAAAKAMVEDQGLSDSEVRQIALNFVAAQTQSLAASGLTMAAPVVVIDRSTGLVQLTANLSVATTFGRIMTVDSLDYARTASAVYSVKLVELAIAIDITGSMNQNGKLQHVKNAAKDVLDTLLASAINDTTVRVALVPWSSSVNAGALANVASNGASVDDCVVERNGSEAETDAAPGPLAALSAVPSLPYGNYICPSNAVVPLKGKSQLDAMKDAVENYTADGWTAGHIGTAWAWYLVSPKWASVLPVESRPNPHDPAKVIKSVIIMSDGKFNTSFISGSTTPEADMVTESYARFQALCTNMKAAGVLVYTVGFDMAGEEAATEQLKTCASSTQHFFLPANGNDLNTTFQNIARQLTQLRLAK